ncbi:MAG: hypothetical protein ABEJ70_03280 [Halobacteriaceae archaeon]
MDGKLSRRLVLSAAAGAAGLAAAGDVAALDRESAATGSDADGALRTETRPLSWAKRRLREAIPNYWEPPDEGVFHLWNDREFHLLETRAQFVTSARVFAHLDSRAAVEDRWDCEDYALQVRGRYAGLSPYVNGVGVCYSFASEHAWNVALTADGAVTHWEPQLGTTVDLGDGDYRLENGVLLL